MSIADVPVIARALMRNHTVAAILGVQVLVATACVTNLAFLLSERVATLRYETGLEETNLGVIRTEYLGDAAANAASSISADLEVIRQQPGVQSVVAVESLPLTQRNWSVGFTNRPLRGNDTSGIVEAEPTVYTASSPVAELLGLRVIAGRDLSKGSFVPMESNADYGGLYKSSEALISQALAAKLFPEGGAVGKFLYADAQHPIQVVGVVKTLSRPVLKKGGDNDMSLILPLIPDGSRVMFAIRAAEGRVDEVVLASEAALSKRDSQRTISRSSSFSDLRADYFRQDQTMAIMFLSSGLALMVVTATGVYGLASFWVRKRYRQIGIRRALGARRRDIVRHFLIENLIVSVIGAIVGTVLAVGLNIAIARYFEVGRIEAPYLSTGVLAVLLMGQAAAFIPSWRASRDVPVANLRTS
ncbi:MULTISPECIES: FtsX-like permease family protein [unclassified Stenotrophomonas]|uniref:ABC transporter permease n=1 Tax=unclassified Stenotrophomonas TaxID=196198 RepID=UPI002118BEB4|nr:MULTISPECIES: FtsX-like permease family protein [unclassified Stenotrophomonas]